MPTGCSVRMFRLLRRVWWTPHLGWQRRPRRSHVPPELRSERNQNPIAAQNARRTHADVVARRAERHNGRASVWSHGDPVSSGLTYPVVFVSTRVERRLRQDYEVALTLTSVEPSVTNSLQSPCCDRRDDSPNLGPLQESRLSREASSAEWGLPLPSTIASSSRPRPELQAHPHLFRRFVWAGTQSATLEDESRGFCLTAGVEPHRR